MNWAEFRGSKSYDLLMGVPLILWFGGAAVRLRPALVQLARMLLEGQGNLHAALLFGALFASSLFNLLLVYLVVVRDPPVRKSEGCCPALCGLCRHLPGGGNSAFAAVNRCRLPWLVASDVFQIVGFAGAAVVLAQLGKSFSIMPEARVLVTVGPYAYARHPLYAVESLCIAGNAILFLQPWAGLLAAAVVALQVARSVFEERVLLAAWPAYAEYRGRTKRFIPGRARVI